YSQNTSCEYTLELFDTNGDGWRGASLTVSINGEPTNYALNNIADDGSFGAFQIPITTGDNLVMTFNPGFMDEDISFILKDAEGNIVFQILGAPPVGLLFSDVLACPTCLAPEAADVIFNDIRAFTAEILWKPVDSLTGSYLIEFGRSGFTLGTGSLFETEEFGITLTELTENTSYDFYYAIKCTEEDTSIFVGPLTFTTLWANDVGVVDLLSPMTACDLGTSDTVNVLLQNFGAAPQTLIPFSYSVNGVDAGVSMPTDGLWTGVLGKDSTSMAEFDQRFNFATPGEYFIQAWTQLSTDSFLLNDTFEITVVSIPQVDVLPYFEDFESWGGGWLVGDDAQNSSWERGIPDGEIINSAAGGDFAWLTSIDSTYNNDERSYLVSPCLDFSNLMVDPRISFALNVETEECCDRAWLEVSTDDGSSWSKVGTALSGINWYNDTANTAWSGNGGFQGWGYAANTLVGTAGESDVRLRFVFRSDASLNFEGVGIDNILISEPTALDLAMTGINRLSQQACGSTEDTLSVTINNLGAQVVTAFSISFRLSDGTLITETVEDVNIGPDESLEYRFSNTFNSFEQDGELITAFVDLIGDSFRFNDSLNLTINTLESLPLIEDFEGGTIPTRWSTDGIVTNEHGLQSFAVSDALSNVDTSFELITPLLGTVEQGDSLSFEYRFVSTAGAGSMAETLNAGDELSLSISTDCGETYESLLTIDSSNHMNTVAFTRVVVFLDDYIGENIVFRFSAVRGADNYWVDIDNINVVRCPESLDLSLRITDETDPALDNGTAVVDVGAGEGPYTYEWSTGDETRIISRLDAGFYSVTVTDRFGCVDNIDGFVGLTTDLEELTNEIERFNLAPNPTNGILNVYLGLHESNEVNWSLINSMGQVISTGNLLRTKEWNTTLDLSSYSDGLYVLKVQVGNKAIARKILKQ
ncbi:MAG: T9SS type A sorting domain-containing protein, partial [Bacteroidota bacterium]